MMILNFIVISLRVPADFFSTDLCEKNFNNFLTDAVHIGISF